MTRHPFVQLFLARLREFYREPEALFWVYGFPVLLTVGLGVAFWNRKPEPPAVDVLAADVTPDVSALREYLRGHGVDADVHDAETCRQRLRTGKTALTVVPLSDRYQYLFDESRPESLAARYQVDALVQRWKAGDRAWPAEDVGVDEPGSRYIDFLIPGIMGLNLMGGGLWGVGFVIVDMRVRKLLKRLIATPMRRADFLLAILVARLLFLTPEMFALVLLGRYGFGVPLRCPLTTLFLVIVIGATAFSGIGLLVACRADKTETVSGLMNLVMLPMWLLSGTFFSSRRFPDAAQPFVQALPLTQLNDTLRETMLEGASLGEVSGRLAVLVGYAVVTFVLALKWFRWQ